MIPPTESDKGVAKWSLVADDNANSDGRINWAEGMYPSAVNDSARMMMTRIREQYDMDREAREARKLARGYVPITADSYSVVSLTSPGLWGINFTFTDKLTEEMYAKYKAGKLQLLVDLVAPKIIDDINYKKLNYNSIISIGFVFKIGTNIYTHAMQFKLNFFGIEKTNKVISFHELGKFINNTTLTVCSGGIVYNYYAIPMEKTYMGSKKLTVITAEYNVKWREFNFNRQYYYISANECIFIDNVLDYLHGARGGIVVYIPLVEEAQDYILLSDVRANKDINVYYKYVKESNWHMLLSGHTVPIMLYAVHPPNRSSGRQDYRAVIYLKVTKVGLDKYPMILEPTVENPYPVGFD